jgi:predicted NBD/HSP70 family sugar kinase
LKPDGVFSLGLKVGRRRTDLVLIDFVGTIVDEIHQAESYPTPSSILSFVANGIPAVTRSLPARQRARIAGLGIAALDQWRSFDLRDSIAKASPWPVYFYNDATAACAAELVFGNAAHYPDFLYFFIGSFVGGGVVLNGQLVSGRTGNAGAVGSMPVVTDAGGRPTTQQLLRSASIYLLANKLIETGGDASVLSRRPP